MAQHAPAVIGYPVDAGDQRIDRTQASVGLLSWFTDAGFRQIGRRRGYYDGGRIDALVLERELGARPDKAALP